MESHILWGIIFIAGGLLTGIFLPVISVIPLVIGTILILFGDREKRIEEVKE